MSNWTYLAGIGCFMSVGIAGLITPLKRDKGSSMLLVVGLFAIIIALYAHWGAFSAWRTYVKQESQKKAVAQLLASVGGREGLIVQLKSHLTQTPDSAKGWLLLGKLYLSVGDKPHAREAFDKAHELGVELD